MTVKSFAGFCLSAAALSLVFYGTAARADTIRIGLISPLTGAGAPWGIAAKVAGEILADRINAAGGIEVAGEKHQVQIIAYDDQYKASEAVAAYNRLVHEDEVRFIIISGSASTMAVKQNVEDDKIVTLTSSYAESVIDPDARFMFRHYSVTRDFMPAFADWVKTNLPDRKLVLMNPNDETGWAHNEMTSTIYARAGIDVIGQETYERAARDFAPQLTKILAMSPDLIDVGSSSPSSAGLIVRQAREQGFQGSFLQTGGAGWATILETAGKAGAEGLVNILYADPANPAYQALAAEYEKRVGQRPNEIIVPYYDAYSILLKAIAHAGDIKDTEKVIAAIPQVLPTQSLLGDEITWAPQQFLTYDYIAVLRDGVPVIQSKVR